LKKLIISIDPVAWCSKDIIDNEEDDFEILIIRDIGDYPYIQYPGLCYEAIKAQRFYDIFNLGKEYKIEKIRVLGFSDTEYKLAMQLQIYISVSGVNFVYYQYKKEDVVSKLIEELLMKSKVENKIKF
jgi:hypothetical protein